MYDYDSGQDPLSRYVQVKSSSSRKDDLVGYSDSTYVENVNDDFRCDMMVSMENYNRVLYRDTLVIARVAFPRIRDPRQCGKERKFFPAARDATAGYEG